MDADTADLPFLSNIGLMLTYRCVVACPHCIVEAGPHRTEEMPVADAISWLDQARGYRDGHIKGVALTGGEPFYNLQNLTQISSHAAELGFVVSVVTNGFWASSREKALETLSRVPAIRMLSISTDVHHQRAIPFRSVENAIWAAKELARLYNVAVCADDPSDPEYLRIMDDLRSIGEDDGVRVSPVFPAGRARETARPDSYQITSEPAAGACSTASTPVIFPDGKVSACIGPLLTLHQPHPMSLGNVYAERLPAILDRAESNPMLHTIRVWGPQRLVALLKEHHLDALLPSGFMTDCVCDVCYKLLSDSRTLAGLDEVLRDDETLRMLAYARLYHLGETAMARLYGT
jgi:MoaA/NifB/PqqE/SkfB family radical SAM enzyme